MSIRRIFLTTHCHKHIRFINQSLWHIQPTHLSISLLRFCSPPRAQGRVTRWLPCTYKTEAAKIIYINRVQGIWAILNPEGLPGCSESTTKGPQVSKSRRSHWMRHLEHNTMLTSAGQYLLFLHNMKPIHLRIQHYTVQHLLILRMF